MFEIGTQLWISRSHGYLEVCSKSPKVRDTDISLYIPYGIAEYTDKAVYAAIVLQLCLICTAKLRHTCST